LELTLKKFSIFIFFVIFFIILSSENTNFFYDIVSDFSINYDNTLLYYYRSHQKQKEQFFIYGYDLTTSQFYGFSPSSEFVTTKPYSNFDNSAMAYGALYEGNDFVWYKDFKEKKGYKILYSISGRLSLLALDRIGKNIAIGFDYLDPQKFIYISGVKEFYTYPLSNFGNIEHLFFTVDSKYLLVIYRYTQKYYADLLTLAENPFSTSNFKPDIIRIAQGADKMLFCNEFMLITEEKGSKFLYDLTSYEKARIDRLRIFKDSNLPEKAIFLINNTLYDDQLNKINFDFSRLTNFMSTGQNLQNQIISSISTSDDLFFSQGYLILKDILSNKFFIFFYDRNANTLVALNTFPVDDDFFKSHDLKNIKAVDKSGNIFVLFYFNDQTFEKSYSIYYLDLKNNELKTVFSDNVLSVDKIIHRKDGAFILVKKAYTKGVFRELFQFNYSSQKLFKISGYENVLDSELPFLKRNY